VIVGILQERVKSAPATLLFQDGSGKQIRLREYLNHKEPAIVEHLAFLSVKYRVYLAELYQAIVLARAKGKSVCEELSIEYRGKVGDAAIFLITKDSKVVAQFRVAEDFLSRENICFEGWMDTDKIRRQLSKQNVVFTHSTLIQDLRHGMKNVNLRAEILETQKPKLVQTQYGNSILLTNAVVSDETGRVKLCLWGEQSDLAVVGDIVQIKNARVRTFKGERQLSLGRSGTMSVLQDEAQKQETILSAA